MPKRGTIEPLHTFGASSQGSFTEGSYLYRAGGLSKAVSELYEFYENKFRSDEPPITDTHRDAMRGKHGGTPVTPVTREEVGKALSKCKNGVSSGLDGLTFEGLTYVFEKDDRDRLPQYFTDLLTGKKSVPASWMLGRIVLLPKVSRPALTPQPCEREKSV